MTTLLMQDAEAAVFARQAGLTDLIAVRLRAAELDADLARGVRPEVSVHHALRATQLVAMKHRLFLAACLDSVIEQALHPSHRHFANVEVSVPSVIAAQYDLSRLAAQLRHPDPAPARGIALAQVLLTDGGGPLYRPGRAAALRRAAEDAWLALDPTTVL